MKSIKLLAIILSVLMFQSCIITQEYTIHNDMSGSKYPEIDTAPWEQSSEKPPIRLHIR